ncbi:hypothetical protein [Lederbergia citri]|uniref:Uncharacterized protein n=1 Tax=Lederbergia citri TaxID=2833580 RepID=A0A942TF63_9BACI|nr:hypothetical protein [Lederbergia citri]MBS4195309.1 hypothetical protein [Lederbergia citri]
MIAIDWLFVAGASSIVGMALIERLAGEYGFRWIGTLLKIGLTVAAYGTGLYFLDIIAEVFLR